MQVRTAKMTSIGQSSHVLTDFALVPDTYYSDWVNKNLIKKATPKKEIQKNK